MLVGQVGNRWPIANRPISRRFRDTLTEGLRSLVCREESDASLYGRSYGPPTNARHQMKTGPRSCAGIEHQCDDGFSLPNPIPSSRTCQVEPGFRCQRGSRRTTSARAGARARFAGETPCPTKPPQQPAPIYPRRIASVATTACPSAMPPSFGGTCAWMKTSNPSRRRPASVRASSFMF